MSNRCSGLMTSFKKMYELYYKGVIEAILRNDVNADSGTSEVFSMDELTNSPYEEVFGYPQCQRNSK